MASGTQSDSPMGDCFVFPPWMHLAAKAGHVRILEHLCDAGADVNLPEPRSSQTPLHRAKNVEAESFLHVGLCFFSFSPGYPFAGWLKGRPKARPQS